MALGKTVGELLATVGANELTEWAAFAEMEPFGAFVDDFRAGVPAAVTLNVHRKRDAPTVGPLDLFPWHADPKPAAPARVESPEEIAANIRTKVFGLKG